MERISSSRPVPCRLLLFIIMPNYSREIDAAIEAAAAKRWGSASVQVIRQVESQRNAEAAGSWYVLCVNNEVFCRRREKRELLELLQKANAVEAI